MNDEKAVAPPAKEFIGPFGIVRQVRLKHEEPVHVRLVKKHRFKPYKLKSMRRNEKGQTPREVYQIEQSRLRRERAEAERLKRLNVNITYYVPVLDEEGGWLGWQMELALTAPAPELHVSKINRYVAPELDWWNNVGDPKCIAYIRMLHIGEVAGGRPVVEAKRLTNFKHSAFWSMDEEGRRKCERRSCIQWAHAPWVNVRKTRNVDKYKACERMVRLYIVGCARADGWNKQSTDARDDACHLLPMMRDLDVKSDKKEDEVSALRLAELLPIFNHDLVFNPIDCCVRFPAFDMTSPFMELARVPEAPSRDQTDVYGWFFKGLAP